MVLTIQNLTLWPYFQSEECSCGLKCSGLLGEFVLLKKAIKNAGWLAGDRIVAMGSNLVVTLVLARALGPIKFGTVNYLIAIVAIAGPLAGLGLNALVTREVVRRPAEEDKVMATAAAFRLAASISCAILIALYAIFSSDLENKGLRGALLLLALSTMLNGFHVTEFWFQAKSAMRSTSALRSIITILFGLIKVCTVLYSPEVVHVVLVFALENIALSAGYFLLYQNKGAGFRWRAVSFEYGRNLLRQSFWLILSGFAAIIYIKIDQIMIANLSSHEELGLYSAAARLSEVWYFFATALVTSFFPLLLHYKESELKRYLSYMQGLCDALLLTSLCLALIVTMTAPYVILVLYGSAYEKSALILAIHIWAGVFVFMRELVSKWLIVENLLSYSLISHGIGAVINVGLNYFMIPLWGGVGAAIATCLSYSVAAYFSFLISPRTRFIGNIMTSSLVLVPTLGIRYWEKGGAKKW